MSAQQGLNSPPDLFRLTGLVPYLYGAFISVFWLLDLTLSFLYRHAMLAKTQGVNKLVVVINKMDDATVNWSHERYLECTTKLSQFLKGTGYNLKTDVFFMPIAAQQTLGIKDRVPKDKAPWYDGPSLLEYLDGMQSLDRKVNAPFMMAVAGKYRDMGTMIEGKIEAGGRDLPSILPLQSRQD